jgi:hypothetical protein
MNSQAARIVDFPLAPMALGQVQMKTGTITVLRPGELIAMLEDEQAVRCDVLISAAGISLDLAQDDKVLIAITHDSPAGLRGIVLGRVAPYGEQRMASKVVVSAAQGVEVRCGEASIDLRADGKVLIKGEDVLLRAKGTQRIRAGNVAIN